MKKCKCMYCLSEFEAERKKNICPDCRNIGKDIAESKKTEKRKGSANDALVESVRIIDRYNAEHGTRYSYGNFPFKKLLKK